LNAPTEYTARTYFYGHGSWLFVVVFFAFFALRAYPSLRRRQGRPGVPAPKSSFTDTPPSRDVAQGVDEASGKVVFTGIAPGWLIDPSGRHERRYWSGSAWTEHVTDGGVPGTDPPPRGPEAL
jgi:hypothetical protein